MGLVIIRVLVAFALVVATTRWCHADVSASAPGREAFEAGVAATSRSAWREAATAFEASLRDADRPATRFNLVLVYAELHEALEVAKHALVFLRLPEEPSRSGAREKVVDALKTATDSLAVLTTDSLPTTVTLHVDGEAPTVMDDERRIYLRPGEHRLEAVLNDAPAELVTLKLSAGQTTSWPRVTQQAVTGAVDLSMPAERTGPSAAPEPASSPSMQASHVAPSVPQLRLDARDPSRIRRALAWSFGVGGALTAAAGGVTYGLLVRKARRFEAMAPENEGFVSAGKEYQHTQNLVAPLALIGSASIVGAIMIAPRSACWRHPAIGWSTIVASTGLVVAGSFLAIRTPDNLGETSLEAPSRQAGSLLLASAFPLFTAGLKSIWQSPSERQERCSIDDRARADYSGDRLR